MTKHTFNSTLNTILNEFFVLYTFSNYVHNFFNTKNFCINQYNFSNNMYLFNFF